jgi:hypothetical protein
MSHRITLARARELNRNELEKRALIKSGVPYHSRRRKKYELMRKRQDGILWRIVDRIKRTGGKMPKHLDDEEIIKRVGG